MSPVAVVADVGVGWPGRRPSHMLFFPDSIGQIRGKCLLKLSETRRWVQYKGVKTAGTTERLFAMMQFCASSYRFRHINI